MYCVTLADHAKLEAYTDNIQALSPKKIDFDLGVDSWECSLWYRSRHCGHSHDCRWLYIECLWARKSLFCATRSPRTSWFAWRASKNVYLRAGKEVSTATFARQYQLKSSKQGPLDEAKKSRNRRLRELREDKFRNKKASEMRHTKWWHRGTQLRGNLKASNCPIKGHTRGSKECLMKAMKNAGAASKNIPALSPYIRPSHGRDKKIQPCNGSKHCDNPNYPSRKSGIDTFNRDSIGSTNIVTIGLTSALAKDGPIPPFRPSVTMITRSW